jgi:hypothetical protein
VNVLVLDPGEKVGYARADIDEHGNWTDVRHGITPLWDMAEAVADSQGVVSSAGRGYDVIVVETWRLYQSHAKILIGSTFPSVQFIGAIKLICKLTGTEYVEQPASMQGVKSTGEESLGLVRLKIDYPEYYELATRPVAHDDGHDQSALAHMAAFTFKRFGPRKQDWMVD